MKDIPELNEAQNAAVGLLADTSTTMHDALAAVRELADSPVQHAFFLNKCQCGDPDCKGFESGVIAVMNRELLLLINLLIQEWEQARLADAIDEAARIMMGRNFDA